MGEKIRTLMIFISERKYYVITTFMGLVHALFCVIFFRYDVIPMGIFNIISPIVYFCMRWVLRQGKLIVFLLFAYVEIVIHAIAATFCVGWNCGFAQYIIAVVPLGFLGAYEIAKGRHRITVPFILGIFASVTYVVCRQLFYAAEAPYPLAEKVQSSLFIFNSIGTFFFLLCALILYTITLVDMEQQLLRKNAILNKKASIDPLTNLLNRRSMAKEFEAAAERDEPFAVAMCDIDDFKNVNDSYGHEAGDLVLREVSRIITESVPEDSPICRWGGEEILILFNNQSLSEALVIAEQIRERIANNEIPFYMHTLRITITIGVAPHKNGRQIEETISDADSRLYIGKGNGKNRVVS
ncbi:MAG: GGDEF domain-containing protein [Lachnospiraceae bacterium]|nr:GGDEF domain-containing protein [Lachnospiraceae bacterium]